MPGTPSYELLHLLCALPGIKACRVSFEHWAVWWSSNTSDVSLHTNLSTLSYGDGYVIISNTQDVFKMYKMPTSAGLKAIMTEVFWLYSVSAGKYLGNNIK
jgi:hypothetical protein